MEKEALNISNLEELIRHHRFNDAFQMLVKYLSAFETGGGFVIPDREDYFKKVNELYNRLAKAISSLLINPSLHISDKGFQLLMIHHKHIQSIFRLSNYGNADHIIKANEFCSVEDDVLRKSRLYKSLIAYSIYSEMRPDYSYLFENYPEEALASFIAMLSTEVLLDQKAYDYKDSLLDMGYLLKKAKLPDYLLTRLSNAWMGCSYSAKKDKHAIKKDLNRLIQNWLCEKSIQMEGNFKERQRNKPLVLTIAEHFRTPHAVCRCFMKAASQIKERFHHILMVEEKKVDDAARGIFDEVIIVDYKMDGIKGIVDKVRSISPDIIYFPSIGMLGWTLALANIRLAPVQFATLGHPATTMSEFIDYMFIGSNHFFDEDLFSERLVVMSTPFPMRLRDELKLDTEPVIKTDSDSINIAVTAVSYKLNPYFMSLCKRIKDNCSMPLRFHFFPLNSSGLRYDLLNKEIRDWLPDAYVYKYSPYNEYLSRLKNCDIYLGTFPFGGTNSNLDCLMLGIPGVVYEGIEPHSRLDSRIVRLFGLPEWLITRNQEEYETAVMRLIQNKEERIALSRMALERRHRVTELEEEGFGKQFVDSIWYVYKNHQKIKNNPNIKVITQEMIKQDAKDSAYVQ